jgi:acyl carrier protein
MLPPVSSDQVLQTILDAVTEVTGIDTTAAALDSSLESLGLDSIDLLEVGMVVEQALGVVVPAERFDGASKLADVERIFVEAVRNGDPD